MNTTDGGLHFEADLNNEKLEKKLDEAYKKIDAFVKDVEGSTSKIDESFSKAGGNFAKELSEGIKQLGIDTKLTGKELKDTLQNADDFVKGMEVGLREAVKLNAQLAEEIGKLPEGFERDTLTEEWSRMNVEIDDAAAGIEELRKYISDVKYESADLSTQFNRAKAEMEQLVLQGEKGSPKYQALVQEAENLKDAMKQVSDEISLVTDPSGMQGFISVLTAASGVAASAAGVMGLFGEKSEQVAVITEKINSIMAIAVGLQNISTQGLTALTAVSNFFAGAQTKVATALNISAASARLFLGVITGGLILAVPLLISLIDRLVTKQRESVRAQTDLQNASLEGARNAAQEVNQLERLYKIATNVKKSITDRTAATKEMQKIWPAQLGHLKAEIIMNGKAADSYRSLRREIVAASQARAAQAKVDAIMADTLEEEERIKERMRKSAARMIKPQASQQVMAGSTGAVVTFTDTAQAKRDAQREFRAQTEELKQLYIERNKLLKPYLSYIDKNTPSYYNETNDDPVKTPSVSPGRSSIVTPIKNEIKKELQQGSLAALRAELADIQDQFENTSDELVRDMLNVRKGMVEGQVKAIEDRYKVEEDGNKKLLDDFMKAHQSFEQQKTEITDRYSKIREGIESSNISSEEKTRLLASAAEEEGKEISNAFLKGLQDNPEWVEAFGNIEVYTVEKLKNLRELLVTQLEKMNSNGAAASDIKAVQDQIIKIDALINRNDNPFETIAEGFRKMGDEGASMADKLAGAKQAMEGVYSIAENLNQIIDSTREIFTNLGGDVDSTFGDILNGLNQTVDGLVQFGEGATQALEGFASGNMLQAAAGAMKAISGLVKAVSGWFNGDKRTERAIREQARLIDELKYSYDRLAFAAVRAYGAQKYDAQKDLMKNLELQRKTIETQMKLEEAKKKTDKGKVQAYKETMAGINETIIELSESLAESIIQTDLKSLTDQLGDALVDAFSRGEDAAKAYSDVAEEVMRNAIINALKVQLLEEPMKKVTEKLLESMGYGAEPLEAAAEKRLQQLERDLLKVDPKDEKRRIELEEKIRQLRAEISKMQTLGSFDGLTKEEQEEIKRMMGAASENYSQALEAYKDLFDSIGVDTERAQGLKGDIKGVTEKTAGALEAQMNAIRINQAASLQLTRDSLLQLQNIADNTYPLHKMQKDLAELNSKVVRPLAGL